MEAAIRVDASISIGTGHVTRCLTLADQLITNGYRVSFICREHEGNLCDYIILRGYPVYRLKKPDRQYGFSNPDNQDEYLQWLGKPVELDAAETKHIIESLFAKVDLLIVDHYAIDAQWEKLLNQCVHKLMVIDDLANRSHHCQILLDQNYYGEQVQRYLHLVPAVCNVLEGPSYSLLRPEFQQLRAQMSDKNGEIGNIMVFMGGSDPDNTTLMVINAIESQLFSDITVRIVVGASNPHKQEIKAWTASRPSFEYYENIGFMAKLMADADLAIGAGGSTIWERCCLGVPSVVITIAENQIEMTKALASINALLYLGRSDEIVVNDIKDALNELITSPQRVRQLAQRSKHLVDGFGVRRVVDEIMRVQGGRFNGH